MTNEQINQIAWDSVQKIHDKFRNEIIKVIEKNLWKIAKGTYLANYWGQISTAIALMFSNPQCNWFMDKWAIEANKNSGASLQHKSFDDGRKWGMLQGLNLAIISLLQNFDDWWFQPQTNVDLKNKPLNKILDLIYDKLFDEIYQIFDKLYTKEMAEHKVSRKALYKVLLESNK